MMSPKRRNFISLDFTNYYFRAKYIDSQKSAFFKERNSSCVISKAGGNGALVQTWFLSWQIPPCPLPHNSLVEFPSLFNTLTNTSLYYFKQGQKRLYMTQKLVSAHKNIIYFFNTASTLQNSKNTSLVPRPFCANRVSGGRLAPTAI